MNHIAVCDCCYHEDPGHHAWCPYPTVRDNPTSGDAEAALITLAQAFDNGGCKRPWTIALHKAVAIGRNLLQSDRVAYRERLAAAGRCMADRDGDCDWHGCPQNRDGEPKRSGRHCPRDQEEERA
jgi:hypothetical protein